MTVQEFARIYVTGNRAMIANPDQGIYQVAESMGYVKDTPEWEAFVAGGAAFIFNGHTFLSAVEGVDNV